MLSATMFFLSGVCIAFGFWTSLSGMSMHFVPMYYISAVVTLGLGVSLKRHQL